MNGVSVFSALHTGTNKYGEICSVAYTPTNAHNQFMPALAEISNSLKTYGHSPLQIVFTDNVHGDKPELERVFPELLAGVTPVPDSSSLEHLGLPEQGSGCDIVILSSSFQVNTQLNSIMDDISGGEDVFVALDMEWPVDHTNGI